MFLGSIPMKHRWHPTERCRSKFYLLGIYSSETQARLKKEKENNIPWFYPI